MKDKDFGEWLVKEKLLQQKALSQAMEIYRSSQSRLDTVLLDLGLIPESTLLDATGRFHTTRTVSRSELSAIGPTVARTLSPHIAARLRVVPFRLEGKTLSVATLEPGDLLVEDELAVVTGCLIASYVTLEIRLHEALNHLYGAPLSAQFQSLIRRSDQGSRKAEHTPSAAAGQSTPQPSSSEPPSQEPWLPHQLRRREPDVIDPLEVSEEDLDLFPSLRKETAREPVREVAQPIAQRTPPPDADMSPEERMAATAFALQNAEIREDIADAVLGFCAPLFKRRVMLFVRGETVMGWRGEGDGVDPDKVREISIPLSEPSVFVGLTQGVEFWLGPLPEMPRNTEIVNCLGGNAPKECFILPVVVRQKTVCFLYYDNADEGVGELPMADLRRLAAKASLAFQVYLLKSKIRNL
jgi:hypothetical protein